MAFSGHATDSTSKAIYDTPSAVAPADRIYATDVNLEERGGGVTNKALTSNVAALTTASAHGISVGATVVVADVGAPFDGTYVTTSGTTGSTIHYARTNADVSSAAATGTVKSGTDGLPDSYDPADYASQPGAAARANGYPRA